MKDIYTYYFSKIRLFIKNFVHKLYINKNEEFIKIIKKNRIYLETVSEFLDKKNYEENDYGMPPIVFLSINKKINNLPTYSDLINFLNYKIFNCQLNYLETGVSVMKNFLQVDNFLENSFLFAYEIEELNPLFIDEYDIIDDNLRTKFALNEIKYFKGDLGSKKDNLRFNELLKNIKFDFVFSDAHHQPWSLTWEYKNVIKENLNDEFIIYFDDVNFPGIEDVVNDIKKDLEVDNEIIYGISFFTNGWIGQHEKFHKNIIISTFDVYKILKEEKIKLPSLKKI